MAPPPLLGARVKSVLSGDTIVLVPAKPGAATATEQERILSLAYITAPRLNANESHGFESREYLRKLLVGKPIQFRVLYSINGREYGDVVAPIFKSLIEKALTDGIAKLRDDASSKDGWEDDDNGYGASLTSAQEKAQSAQLGVWSHNLPAPVAVLPSLSKDIIESKKEYPGVVERVVSGDRVQIRAFVENGSHFVGNILIAGIRTPRSTSPDAPAEPHGDAAKNFVSSRLLQRSVRVTFLAQSNTGVPIAQLSHPAGDIADALLRSGLATVADWQSQYLGAQKMSGLRSAEKFAKDSNLNLWKATGDVSSSSGSATDNNTFEAVIAKVISPDTYVIRLKSNEERTVQLASVRAPRKNDVSPLDLYVPISKEFARSKFIAKKVNVTVISVRPKTDQFDERELVTLNLQGKDIALTLIENGYATVIRHRKGDDHDRSPIWDELLEKESQAIASQVGIHSKKTPTPLRIVDASESLAKAKGFLSSLERQSRIPAVVDFISSAGRLRLVSSRENIILTLVLAGVRVPKPQEPHGSEALDYVAKRLWQRDVQFEVINVDKTGGFIGHVYLAGSSIPLSVALVKEGLAEVHEYSARQSGLQQVLEDAEADAKKQKKGLWVNFIEEEEVAPTNDTTIPAAGNKWPATGTAGATQTNATNSKRYIDIIVTDISSAGTISYQTPASSAQYSKLSAELASYNLSAANSSNFVFKSHVKRGDAVTVSTGPSKYARGKVVSFDKPDKYTVELADTGAVKVVGVSSLRPLPSQFSLAIIPSFAKPTQLSFVQVPPASYLDDYVTYLEGKVKGKQLVANVDFSSASAPASVTLYSADSKGADDSFNASLIYDGYAFVSPVPSWARDPSWNKIIESLIDAESGAKSDRVGVWEYGDPRDLED